MSDPGLTRRIGPGGCRRPFPRGTVPIEESGGYAWPTWREALIDAFKMVDDAYERRRQTVQAAYDAGLTLRQIAEVVGISAAGVHRMIGKQRRGADATALLDAPANTGRTEVVSEPDRGNTA